MFQPNVEDVLTAAGWFPDRKVPDLLRQWEGQLTLSDGFELFPEAERALLEFGGLDVNQSGAGKTCSREPFSTDPLLAIYEGDRFREFSQYLDTRLYPLGEACGGLCFLAIDERGRVYFLMDDLQIVGENIEEALNSLIVGIMPRPVRILGKYDPTR